MVLTSSDPIFYLVGKSSDFAHLSRPFVLLCIHRRDCVFDHRNVSWILLPFPLLISRFLLLSIIPSSILLPLDSFPILLLRFHSKDCIHALRRKGIPELFHETKYSEHIWLDPTIFPNHLVDNSHKT